MIFEASRLAGAYLIGMERLEDERGFFARSFCRSEFEQRGLNPSVSQCNVSFNRRRGTLRGMHFQAPPHAEAKLVRCTAGAIYDVIVDLRSDSETYLQWESFELTAENRKALYIPENVAHGFQCLSDDVEVSYQMSESYAPESARGVSWNDPAFCIRWPIADPILSAKDASYPPFEPET